MKINILFLLLISSISLSAFIFEKTPPKCSDKETINSLKKIYININKQQSKVTKLPKSIKSLNSIRATSYNRDIALRGCKALVKLSNDTELNMQYTVQLDETNSDNFYVEIEQSFISNLIAQSYLKNLRKTKFKTKPAVKVEPLFEPLQKKDMKSAQKNDTLNSIASKFKAQPSLKPIKDKKHTIKQTYMPEMYYIAIGTFSRYKPSKKYFKNITNNGYKYTFHKKVSSNETKILIGPFENENKAKNELPIIRKNIEPGAFLYKNKDS